MYYLLNFCNLYNFFHVHFRGDNKKRAAFQFHTFYTSGMSPIHTLNSSTALSFGRFVLLAWFCPDHNHNRVGCDYHQSKWTKEGYKRTIFLFPAIKTIFVITEFKSRFWLQFTKKSTNTEAACVVKKRVGSTCYHRAFLLFVDAGLCILVTLWLEKEEIIY